MCSIPHLLRPTVKKQRRRRKTEEKKPADRQDREGSEARCVMSCWQHRHRHGHSYSHSMKESVVWEAMERPHLFFLFFFLKSTLLPHSSSKLRATSVHINVFINLRSMVLTLVLLGFYAAQHESLLDRCENPGGEGSVEGFPSNRRLLLLFRLRQRCSLLPW